MITVKDGVGQDVQVGDKVIYFRSRGGAVTVNVVQIKSYLKYDWRTKQTVTKQAISLSYTKPEDGYGRFGARNLDRAFRLPVLVEKQGA